MIVFNECRIDKEGKNLIIDASVNDLSYYKDIYIRSITIDTDETFVDGSKPSANPVYSTEVTGETPVKHIRMSINHRELKLLDNLNNNIFFVYIRVGGVPAIDTPCGCDNEYSVAVAANLKPVYDMSMNYIKELDSTCNIPKGFIDMILRLNAFRLSVKTGNFLTAIKQWNKLLKNKKFVSPIKGCGCNGTV